MMGVCVKGANGIDALILYFVQPYTFLSTLHADIAFSRVVGSNA